MIVLASIHKRSQAMNEAVIVGTAIIVVLLLMRPYIKGGVASKLKSMSDSAFAGQYDPREGTHAVVMHQTGTSVSKSSIVKKEKANTTDKGWYVVNYQTSGPAGATDEQGNLFRDVNNNIVIDHNANRKASKMTSAEYSEYEWKDFKLD